MPGSGSSRSSRSTGAEALKSPTANGLKMSLDFRLAQSSSRSMRRSHDDPCNSKCRTGHRSQFLPANVLACKRWWMHWIRPILQPASNAMNRLTRSRLPCVGGMLEVPTVCSNHRRAQRASGRSAKTPKWIRLNRFDGKNSHVRLGKLVLTPEAAMSSSVALTPDGGRLGFESPKGDRRMSIDPPKPFSMETSV